MLHTLPGERLTQAMHGGSHTSVLPPRAALLRDGREVQLLDHDAREGRCNLTCQPPVEILATSNHLPLQPSRPSSRCTCPENLDDALGISSGSKERGMNLLPAALSRCSLVGT